MTWTHHARLWTILVTLYGCASESERNDGCGIADLGAPICADKEPDRRALVTGSTVEVLSDVGAVPPEGETFTYELTSDSPDIAEPTSASVGSTCAQQSVLVNAKKAGTTTLHFKGPAGDKTVEVRVEDAARLDVVPFLDEISAFVAPRDGIRPSTDVDELAQVSGGSMRWRVHYYGADDQELRGRGVLQLQAPAFATATPLASNERELFELTGTAVGAGELELKAGPLVATWPVRVVPLADVRSVTLFVQDDGADAGAELHAMARAWDQTQKPVYGAGINYVVGGKDVGAGDYVSYALRAGKETTLEARVGGVSTTTTLQTDETNAAKTGSDRDLVNCSLGGAGSAGANFAFVAALVGLGLRRRRAA